MFDYDCHGRGKVAFQKDFTNKHNKVHQIYKFWQLQIIMDLTFHLLLCKGIPKSGLW